MEQQYFLGVDIGTTAIKAALFDGCGQKLLHRTQEYELLKPSAQRVEQAPHVYWDTFCACVKYVVQNSGVDPRHIKAFSMDSSAETIAFMDEHFVENERQDGEPRLQLVYLLFVGHHPQTVVA